MSAKHVILTEFTDWVLWVCVKKEKEMKKNLLLILFIKKMEPVISYLSFTWMSSTVDQSLLLLEVYFSRQSHHKFIALPPPKEGNGLLASWMGYLHFHLQSFSDIQLSRVFLGLELSALQCSGCLTLVSWQTSMDYKMDEGPI